MYAYIIIGLVLAMASLGSAPPAHPPSLWLLLPMTVATALLVAVAGSALSAYILLRRGELATNEFQFLRHVAFLGKGYRMLVLAAYAFILFGLGWSDLATSAVGDGGWMVVGLAIALAPYVVLLGVSWVAVYGADRSLKAALLERAGAVVSSPQWSLLRYIEFMLRQYLLVILVPLLALVTYEDVISRLAGMPGESLGATLLMFAGLGTAALLAAPWVSVCWRTEPLPAGDLRERLLAVAERAGVRVANVLVWRTNLSMANGCMIGFVGPLRYIMLTDVILVSMTPQELEAVFAHEVAHVKYHHTALYMLVALGAGGAGVLTGMLAGAVVPGPVAETVGDFLAGFLGGDLESLVTAATALVCIWFGFGYLSRRCEQEADMFAARATMCPAFCSPPDAARAAVGAFCAHRVATFCGALQRISRLAGSPETRSGWRHFSIARRCWTLAALLADPPQVMETERRMRYLKMAAVGLAIALAIAAGAATAGSLLLEPDNPQNPAGPDDVRPPEGTLRVYLVDRNQVDLVALGPPEFDRQADVVADADDGRLAGLGLHAAAADDDVAVEDAGRHAVAVHA